MQTPYEQTGEWTSREDGEAFLDAAASQYGFPVEALATSVEGRPVRAALLGAHPDDAEQTVLLVAAQHGDEPASREGAFALIRDLAELESRYTKVWRQPTPPPAGTTYEWAGERHASESIKRLNGQEVARNLVPDPGFEQALDGVAFSNGIASPVRTQSENLVRSGQWAMRTRGNGESTALQYVYKNITGLTGGDWIAAAVYAYPTAGAAGQVQLRVGFSGGGPRQYVDLHPWVDARGGWRRLSGAAQVPEGYTSAWLMVYMADWNSTALSDGSWHAHDDWQFATADTEDAALAQISTYFDGDTESDRAHDLWYNQAGVPHEWANGQGWVEITDQPELNYLGKTSWVIIPTLNIDRIGSIRRNANGVDLNRDWEDKSQPETWAVLNVLDAWQPTLLIDAHEMNHGFEADVALSTPTRNAPVHPEISRVSGLAHQRAAQAVIDSGSTYQEYPESGAMTLRTYAGTQHANSVLIETYGWNDERAGHLRVADQITVMHALLEHHQIAYNAYRYASSVSRNPETAVHLGGAVPFFTMWHNPQAYVQDKGIVDAYLHTNQSQVRVYDHLGTLL